jgi:hypothetical protein
MITKEQKWLVALVVNLFKFIKQEAAGSNLE